MSGLPLAAILPAALKAGFPAHKSTLIAKLKSLGARCEKGRVAGNQIGFLWHDLPPQIEAALMLEKAGEVEGPSGEWAKYYAAPRSLRKDAELRLRMVVQANAEIAKGLSANAAFKNTSKAFGVSLKAVRDAVKAVSGVPECDRLPCLVKRYRPREAAEISHEIWQFFLSDYGRLEEPPASSVYRRLCSAAHKNGWGKVPSVKTLLRRWQAMPEPQRLLLRCGEKALRQAYPHAERDRADIGGAMGMVSFDARTADIRVKFPGDIEARPVVSLAVDVHSNFILGYQIGRSETTENYRRLVASIAEAYGLPDRVQFDNTRAAANKEMTAGATGRKRYRDLPGDTPGLFVRLGIEVVFTRVENGRSKQVERQFRDLIDYVERHPAASGAYTGNSPVSKPANYGTRAMTLEDYEALLVNGINEANERSGRRGKTTNGSSHGETFRASYAARPKKALSHVQRLHIFRVAKTVMVCRRTGKVTTEGGNSFWDEVLQNYKGRKVVVRYEAENLRSPIWVEGTDGRLIHASVKPVHQGGYTNRDEALAHMRNEREYVKATKAAAKARGLLSPSEVDKLTPRTSKPAAPQSTVIKARFAKNEEFKTRAAHENRERTAELAADGPSNVLRLKIEKQGRAIAFMKEVAGGGK